MSDKSWISHIFHQIKIKLFSSTIKKTNKFSLFFSLFPACSWRVRMSTGNRLLNGEFCFNFSVMFVSYNSYTNALLDSSHDWPHVNLLLAHTADRIAQRVFFASCGNCQIFSLSLSLSHIYRQYIVLTLDWFDFEQLLCECSECKAWHDMTYEYTSTAVGSDSEKRENFSNLKIILMRANKSPFSSSSSSHSSLSKKNKTKKLRS